MTDTSLITVAFPTLDAARSARARLTRAGFARNSIDIERRRDNFEVSISTRDENRRRAEAILHKRSLGSNAGQVGESTRDFVHRNPGIGIGLAALAGFVLFSFTNRR